MFAAVQAFLDVPVESAPIARQFWSDLTSWDFAWPWPGHPELATLMPPAGSSGLSVQEAEGSPRVHVDLYPGPGNDRALDHVVSLGALVVRRHEWWDVLESPGGLPFCLVYRPPGTRAPATAWADGHRSRVVQACIDVPHPRWDDESRFWQAALGWAPTPHFRAEYTDLEAPHDSPLRVILQRLSPTDTATTTRAHLDLGTDDLDAETRRLTHLGAQRLEPSPVDPDEGWVVLADPVGLPFCITGRDP